MNHLSRYMMIVGALISALPYFALPAQEVIDDDDEAEVRLNPQLGTDTIPTAIGRDLKRYGFLLHAKNPIQLNGADWSELQRACEACRHDSAVVNIVQIGDSHIQGEGSTCTTRRMLQNAFGNPGRGLIAPLSVAGTNGPNDYYFKVSGRVRAAKLLRRPWLAQMGFTGVTISPVSDNFSMQLGTKAYRGAASTFGRLRLFVSGDIDVKAVKSHGSAISFTCHKHPGSLDVCLAQKVKDCQIDISCPWSVCYITGASLLDGPDTHGIMYNAIGNNGATYGSYNRLGSVGDGLKGLHPHLVILSMGTNEAFGTFSASTLYQNIMTLVSDIRLNNPLTQILLVTPMECQRRSGARYKWVRRRGRKVRHRVSGGTRVANPNIVSVRDLILRLGREQHIATYDWYAAAGGAGAAARWRSASLMGPDGIHNTWTGYDIQGQMMYHALAEALMPDDKPLALAANDD